MLLYGELRQKRQDGFTGFKKISIFILIAHLNSFITDFNLMDYYDYITFG